MYYVDNDEPLERKYCFGVGPPKYHWQDDFHLANIPDEDASLLDDWKPPKIDLYSPYEQGN